MGRLLLRAVGTSQLAGQVPASCRHASPLGLPASLCWCWGGQRMRGWVGTWPSPRARGLPGLLWLPGPFHWGLWEMVAWLYVCGKPWLPPMAGGRGRGCRGHGRSRLRFLVELANSLLPLLILSWACSFLPPSRVCQASFPPNTVTWRGAGGCLLCPHPCSAAWPGLWEGATGMARRPAPDPSPGPSVWRL